MIVYFLETIVFSISAFYKADCSSLIHSSCLTCDDVIHISIKKVTKGKQREDLLYQPGQLLMQISEARVVSCQPGACLPLQQAVL
jgi:hypothetical protein